MKRFNLFAVMSLLMLLWVAAACATGTPDNHLSHTSDTHSTSFENITQKGLADSNQLPSKPSPTSPIKLSGETTHHEKAYYRNASVLATLVIFYILNNKPNMRLYLSLQQKNIYRPQSMTSIDLNLYLGICVILGQTMALSTTVSRQT